MVLEGFNFDHIQSKKGKDIMFGDLALWVDSCIESNTCSESGDHYITQCPYCLSAYLNDSTYDGPYTKSKLYTKKDKSSGFCFRCDRAYVNIDDTIKLELSLPESKVDLKSFELVRLPSSGTWNLDLFDSFDQNDEKGLSYLISRNPYLKQLAPRLGIKYTNHNPVVPFYYRGDLIYYQIRLAFGSPRIKYFSPPISHKPPYIIEHGTNKKFIICEGTFDAISLLVQAPDYTPFAVLGSTITDYQLTMLRTYIPDKILVYMDDYELSKKVAMRIASIIDYADIDIIKSAGSDPEEVLKQRLAEGYNINWIK